MRDGSDVSEVEASMGGERRRPSRLGARLSDGITNFSHAFTEAGEVAVTVTVRDSRSSMIMLNSPSQSSSSTPTMAHATVDHHQRTRDGDAFAPEDTITFRASVYDAEDPLDDARVTMESDKDGDIPVDMGPDSRG